MTQEEKAKAYDIALARAREIHHNEDDKVKDMEFLFPELKESEDERVRKVLIELVKCNERSGYTLLNNVTTDSMLAWLEKQGEKKPKFVAKKEVTGTLKEMLDNIDPVELEETRNEMMESISTDKVEPKFHKDDWITNGQLTCKVLSVTSKSYELHLYNDDYRHFETDVQSVDKHYHLWSIEDAKDGDVLAGSKGDVILMFRGIGNTEWDDVIDYHCYYDCYRECFAVQEDVEYWGDIKNNQLKPATKEQRDLLFEKMDNTGYMWDGDKKELKLLITNGGDFEPCDKKQDKHKVWTDNDYDEIKSIEYLLHELDNHNFDDWFNYILNNDECKPIVVKKFSEGDWIVKKGHVYGGVPVKIKEIGNYLYLCERQDGVIIELNKNDVLKEYKHWDITDAVNGNVLVYNKTKSPFIYDGKIKNYNTGNPKDIFIGAHCGIYGKGEFIINHVEYWIDNNVQPALKDQRDLLFSKMEEAGYEWDYWKKRCIKK